MYQSGKYTFECSDYSRSKKFRITMNATGEQDGRTRTSSLMNQAGGTWDISSLVLVSFEEVPQSQPYTPVNSTGYSQEQWLQRIEAQVVSTATILREMNDRSKVARF